jgi:hypothetical protein
VAGCKVLDNHEGKPARDRYMGEELLKRLQTTGRSTNADDWEHFKSGQWPYHFGCAIGRICNRCCWLSSLFGLVRIFTAHTSRIVNEWSIGKWI